VVRPMNGLHSLLATFLPLVKKAFYADALIRHPSPQVLASARIVDHMGLKTERVEEHWVGMHSEA